MLYFYRNIMDLYFKSTTIKDLCFINNIELILRFINVFLKGLMLLSNKSFCIDFIINIKNMMN